LVLGKYLSVGTSSLLLYTVSTNSWLGGFPELPTRTAVAEFKVNADTGVVIIIDEYLRIFSCFYFLRAGR
jgi:hypothetical protein